MGGIHKLEGRWMEEDERLTVMPLWKLIRRWLALDGHEGEHRTERLWERD